MSIPASKQHSVKAIRSKAEEARIDSDQIGANRHRRRRHRDRRRAVAIEFVFYGAVEVGAVADDLGGDVGETGSLQLLIDEGLVLRPDGRVGPEIIDYAGDTADVPRDALGCCLGVIVKDLASESDQTAGARICTHPPCALVVGERFVYLLGKRW